MLVSSICVRPHANALDDSPAKVNAKPRAIPELERELRTGSAEKRRTIVKKLADFGTRPAWMLVVGALDDAEPQVADEAEIELGRITDPKLVALLLGRKGLGAEDPWVRLRVAEAFGRMALELDADVLIKEAKWREPELTRSLLWSIERLDAAKKLVGDRAKLVRAVEKLYRAADDSDLRAATLATLGKLDFFAGQPLMHEACADAQVAVRCAALFMSQASTEPECVSLSRKMLGDPETAVRCQAIENLERLSTRASILELVHQLAIEKRERLRYAILGFLQSRSGLEHGFDLPAWRAWAETVTGEWTTGTTKATHLGPFSDTNASFAGLGLLSDRVCFLVDFSGSLWQTKVGDKTRKEIVDEKLRAALEALPSDTRFNVIPYTNDPIPWEKHLVVSERGNVKRAIDFFERCHQSGKGNFYDAALLALSDLQVDTIMVLTDGAPTGGHRWNLDLMFDLLVEKNRFRKGRVRFDPGRREERTTEQVGRVVRADWRKIDRSRTLGT